MSDIKNEAVRLKMIPSIIKNNHVNLNGLTELVNEKLIHDNLKGVSERTISRDIIVLKSKGYEILSKKGYKNKNYYFIESEDDDLDLSENEIKTLPIMMGLINTEENLLHFVQMSNIMMVKLLKHLLHSFRDIQEKSCYGCVLENTDIYLQQKAAQIYYK